MEIENKSYEELSKMLNDRRKELKGKDFNSYYEWGRIKILQSEIMTLDKKLKEIDSEEGEWRKPGGNYKGII